MRGILLILCLFTLTIVCAQDKIVQVTTTDGISVAIAANEWRVISQKSYGCDILSGYAATNKTYRCSTSFATVANATCGYAVTVNAKISGAFVQVAINAQWVEQIVNTSGKGGIVMKESKTLYNTDLSYAAAVALFGNCQGGGSGISSVTHNSTLSGSGTVSSPLIIAQQGASSGQVLAWNGTIWAPATVSGGGGGITAGNKGDVTVAIGPETWTINAGAVTSTKIGNDQVTNQKMNNMSANTVKARNVGTSGDPQDVLINPSQLFGRGSTGDIVSLPVDTQFVITNKLSLSQHGATTGQVLKWNGSSWVPGTAASPILTKQGITRSGDSIFLGKLYSYGGPISADITNERAIISKGFSGNTNWGGIFLNDIGWNTPFRSVAAGDSATFVGAVNIGPFSSSTPLYTSYIEQYKGHLSLYARSSDATRYSYLNVGGLGSVLQHQSDGSSRYSRFLVEDTLAKIEVRDPSNTNTFNVFPTYSSASKRIDYPSNLSAQYNNNTLVQKSYVDNHPITTTARFSGNGTSGSPLELASQSASTGQVLKWNSGMNKWMPATDDTGGGGGIDTIATYTTLRAYTGTSLAVFVQDFSATQGGIFRRVPAGTENGGTLIVATNGVKWKREFDGKTFYPEYWAVGGYDETGVSGGITDITEKIQAAVNMASAVGGEVVLRKSFSPYSVSPKVTNIVTSGRGCVELKNNLKFTIPYGTTIQIGDNQQTNTTSGLAVLYGDTLSNVEISGGGIIQGNTVNQPGYTGGYTQAGVGGSGIYICQSPGASGQFNYNIVVKDLTIFDFFSVPAEFVGVKKIVISNLNYYQIGEGLEMQKCKDVYVSGISCIGDANIVGDGLEIVNSDNFYVDGVTIKKWYLLGSAFDFGVSRNGYITNFELEGFAGQGQGIDLSTSGSGIIATNINFSNGKISNMSDGIITGDGTHTFSNITFEENDFSIKVLPRTDVITSVLNEISITGCHFRNGIGGNNTAIYVLSNKKVFINSCVFDNFGYGVIVTANSTTLSAKVNISASHFNNIASYPILYAANGQSGFTPNSLISGCSFTNNSFDLILLPVNSQNIIVSDITQDSIYIYTNNTSSINSNQMYLSSVSPNNISTLPTGSDGQILSLTSIFGNGILKRIETTGNILLNGNTDFNMPQRCALYLKYSIPLSKWVEVSRMIAGGVNSPTDAVLERKYFLPDWSIENVGSASQTNVIISRLSGLTSYGRDFYIPSNGMVRRFGIISNEPISVGSITANLLFDGGGPNATVSLQSGNIKNTTSFERFGKPFPAETFIGVSFTTSASFAHPNADILIWIDLEY